MNLPICAAVIESIDVPTRFRCEHSFGIAAVFVPLDANVDHAWVWVTPVDRTLLVPET